MGSYCIVLSLLVLLRSLPSICLIFACAFPLAVSASVHTDSDLDGIPDAWELAVFKTDLALADTDGDGKNDRQEILAGWSPTAKNTKIKDEDADQDGLLDRLELAFGVDPTNPDTDGDGYMDGQEVMSAWSPTSTGDIRLQKTIRIDLSDQRMEKRVAGVVLASFPISGGLPKTPTPVGTFKVLNKHPRAWSRSFGLWMPYWMAFTNRGHGIHELPEWPGGYKEGKNHLGRPASHGCVRLGVGPAKEMYDWAPVGTPVIIER